MDIQCNLTDSDFDIEKDLSTSARCFQSWSRNAVRFDRNSIKHAPYFTKAYSVELSFLRRQYNKPWDSLFNMFKTFFTASVITKRYPFNYDKRSTAVADFCLGSWRALVWSLKLFKGLKTSLEESSN